MKIPTSYSNKYSVKQYAQAFKKAPFAKLPFLLQSLLSYPPQVLTELAPLISSRLYPVRHNPRFSKYVGDLTPYLFSPEKNPMWDKWFQGLNGDKEEKYCIERLLATGLMKERWKEFVNVRPALVTFVGYAVMGALNNRAVCDLLTKEGSEEILLYVMENSPPETNREFMRNLHLRQTPMPSFFVENFPVSQVDLKDTVERFGLVRSLWQLKEICAQEFSPEYLRKNIQSFLSSKIYQATSAPSVNQQKILTDFYKHLFKGEVKAHEFLYKATSNAIAYMDTTFFWAIVEASSSEDLKVMVPLWQSRWEKDRETRFAKVLEHPLVVRHLIEKEVQPSTQPPTPKSRKM